MKKFVLSYTSDYGRSTAPTMYDECAVALEYKGPRYCADMLAALLTDKSTALVLDVAAGTGTTHHKTSVSPPERSSWKMEIQIFR